MTDPGTSVADRGERALSASFIRLAPRYDPARLLHDLRTAERWAAERSSWDELHTTRGHSGWSGISLIAARDPELGLEASGPRDPNAYAPTPLLAACPYYTELLAGFHCPKRRVRLVRLAPGGRIVPHCDRGYGWGLHTVRLHVPIVTHPHVRFVVAGERRHLEVGELWYVETTRMHEVTNDSPIARVHLVIDLFVNAWLTELLLRAGLPALDPGPGPAP
jgi:Aspartyl/Asparaginyl beta-hydroxylase